MDLSEMQRADDRHRTAERAPGPAALSTNFDLSSPMIRSLTSTTRLVVTTPLVCPHLAVEPCPKESLAHLRFEPPLEFDLSTTTATFCGLFATFKTHSCNVP